MSNSPSRFCQLALMVATAILPSVCLASHPNHVSNAEVNWNPKSGNFEVALCVWPTDLEKALAADSSKTIDLDKVENLDELMKSYVEKKFMIRAVPAETSSDPGTRPDPARSHASIRWVGHERDHKTAWLYFEVEGDKRGAPWTIENRIFFELNDDQLNQVQVAVGKKSNVIVCRPGEPRFTIDTSDKTELKSTK